MSDENASRTIEDRLTGDSDMTKESFTGAVIERVSGDGLDPDTLLPSQFFRGDPGGVSAQPEKRLMLAVLEDAFGTLQRHAAARTGAGQQHFADVEAWIAADDAQWPFSFLNICHAVGLEPAYLRAGLRRWRDRLRTASDGPSIVIRSPFRHTSGSRTRANELRRSA